PVRTVIAAKADAGAALPVAVPAERFEEIIDPGFAGSPPAVTVQPDEDVTIMYTSGTTGKPKGAVGTHRNLGAFLMNGMYAGAAAAAAAAEAAAAANLSSDDAPAPPSPATLLTFPLFHVG